MPFTPYHFGPGSLVKVIAPKWFCLRVFILTQVIIDCETGWNLLQGNPRLHTFLHSFAGSNAAIVLAISLTLLYSRYASRILSDQNLMKDWIYRPPAVRETIVGSVIGGWSHIVLDGIMHPDMQPFWPLTEHNSYLYLISIESLHVLCLAAFVLAWLGWIGRRLLKLG